MRRPSHCERPGLRSTAAVAQSGGDLHGDHVDGEQLLDGLRPTLSAESSEFFDGVRSGAYNGHLEANTAVRLAGQFRFAVGISALDAYQVEFGKVGTPGVVLEDLSAALTAAPSRSSPARSMRSSTRPRP